MPSNTTDTPRPRKLRRVLVAVLTYAAYGRRIVDGVIEFADRQVTWELESSRDSTELYQGEEPDGVITNITTGPQAEQIERFHAAGIPCVASAVQGSEAAWRECQRVEQAADRSRPPARRI